MDFFNKRDVLLEYRTAIISEGVTCARDCFVRGFLMESRIFLNDALTGILFKAVLKLHQCHNFKSTKDSNVNLSPNCVIHFNTIPQMRVQGSNILFILEMKLYSTKKKLELSFL